MIKIGDAHLDNGCLSNTPIAQSHSISFMRTALCFCRIVNGAEQKKTWYLVNGAEQMETWYLLVGAEHIGRLGT